MARLYSNLDRDGDDYLGRQGRRTHPDSDGAEVQPGSPAQTCTIVNGKSTFAGSDITDVEVNCLVPVAGLYDSATLKWNHYVKNDGSTRFNATGTDCDGSQGSLYSACLHSAEMLTFQVPGRTECTNLIAVDGLDANNPLSVAALSNQTTDLGTIWTLYLIGVDGSGSLNITENHVGLVVAPGAILTGMGGTAEGAISTAVGTRFAWIEGAIKGGNRNNSVFLSGTRLSVVHRVRAQDKDIRLVNSSGNRLSDIFLTRAVDGIELDTTSDFNIIDRVSLFGQGTSSVRIYGNNNLLGDITAANARIGVYISGTSGNPAGSNLLINGVAANIESQGLYLDRAPETTVMNFTVVNGDVGFHLKDATTTARIHNIASANNNAGVGTKGTGVQLITGASATFSGLFKVGDNKVDCAISGVAMSCADDLDTSGTMITNGISLQSSFIGKQVTTDSANTPHSNGSATYSVNLDFLRFQFPRRGWGKSSSFPSFDVQGECTSGTCQIWDLSADLNDAVVRGVLGIPDTDVNAVTLTHTWTISGGATECATIPGASWDGQDCSSMILANAIEIANDGVGNDNLLCESGERCLHTPNIGAYQGHGLTLDPIAGLRGPANDIQLYSYPTNGR